MKLTVHIIVFNKDNMADRQNIFVAMEGINRIRRFRRILSSETHEKAMMFALSRGKVIDPSQVNPIGNERLSNGAGGSTHVILTKDGAYWDLM